jgi:hypothetical protein
MATALYAAMINTALKPRVFPLQSEKRKPAFFILHLAGSFGLVAFAFIIWLLIERAPSLALAFATLAWLTVSILAWTFRRWL